MYIIWYKDHYLVTILFWLVMIIRVIKTHFAVVKSVYYSLYFIGVFFIYRKLPIAKI